MRWLMLLDWKKNSPALKSGKRNSKARGCLPYWLHRCQILTSNLEQKCTQMVELQSVQEEYVLLLRGIVSTSHGLKEYHAFFET